MESVEINFIAVVFAALSMFIIGGLWYSPILFGKKWLFELGKTGSFLQTGNKAIIFGLSFFISLIMALNLAGFISGFKDWSWGLIGGFLAGFGWATLSLGIIYLFERKSIVHFLINGGYLTISFLVMGLILGLWK